jgi:L-arabinose isomerase
MQQELSQIGAPNRALGQEMIARGQRGELTPVQMQQMAALDARQKQQLAQRGLTSGTAQQQQQARMQEMQQRGAQDLIDQGIKIAGIGDQYQAAAIRAGYAADQATRDMLNTTLTNLYRTIYGNVATPETTSKTPPPRG